MIVKKNRAAASRSSFSWIASGRMTHGQLLLAIVFVSVFVPANVFTGPAWAESVAAAEGANSAKPKPPRDGFNARSTFKRDFSPTGFFSGKVVDLTDPMNSTDSGGASTAKKAAPATQDVPPADADKRATEEPKKRGPEFVSSDPMSHIVAPDEDPRVRINPEAPGPFKAMAMAFQDGDNKLAEQYADQFVRYQINLMYEVRSLTKLIGEAFIRQSAIEEDSFIGVEQYLDQVFAEARQENGAILKPTHEESLKRVKPDVKQEAEIYVFLNLNSKYARQIAPDIERLWKVVQSDSRLRMGVFGLGPANEDWSKSFRAYTGLTAPIVDGTELAKTFRVAFVPTIIVVSPTSKTAYSKTGLQNFERLYQFVRSVQGESLALTPAAQQLKNSPIGEVEMAKASGKGTISTDLGLREIAAPKKPSLEKF